MFNSGISAVPVKHTHTHTFKYIQRDLRKHILILIDIKTYLIKIITV